MGYLWLLFLWIQFEDALPREKPANDGVTRRVFELAEVLGPTAGVAALTFVAYLLGALLTLPVEGRAGGRVFGRTPTLSLDARETRAEFAEHLEMLQRRVQQRQDSLSNHELDEMFEEARRASRAGAADLRPRLLVSNQEMYGEYDRLASEASFRMNLCLPLSALGATIATEFGEGWLLPVTIVVLTLLYQGLSRGVQANSVLQRAVLSGVFKHPFESAVDRVLSVPRVL